MAALGNADHLPPTFPVHPVPDQFIPEPLHSPYDRLPPQYITSAHPIPFQNHLLFHGYRQLEPTPYPPPPYFPFPRHQLQPYFPHRPTSGSPPYQQARHFPPSMSQFAINTSTSGPSHVAPYGEIQQYPPHLYSATGHFGLPQQYPPSVYQWYHGPDPSVDRFIEGDPIQLQQHFPMIYSHPRTERPRRDSHMFRMQSTGLEHLPSLSLGPSSSSISITVSQNTISPAAGDQPEHISARSSQKTSMHQPSPQSTAGTSRVQDRPPVHCPFHAAPPSNRSEWVMWVGNVPSDATNDELWRFLKQSATVPSGRSSGGGEDNGVLSIFLISRSNCAFVNYQSEEHLNRAISQFNGRKLRPPDRRCPRLVCRTRRKEDDLRAGVGAQRGIGLHTHYVKNKSGSRKRSESFTTGEETTLFKGRGSDSSGISEPPPSAAKSEEASKFDTVEGADQKAPIRSPSSYASTSSSFLSRHFPKRFFILKSLTRYDLDLSIERGVWATQKHNEAILDQAFRTSMEVILIFSVNRSGEFYGYARMVGGISRSSRCVSWAPRADVLPSTSSPSTAHTPVHGSSEQLGSLSRQSQMYTSPPGRWYGPSFPSPRPSDGMKKGPNGASSSPVRFAQERRSAPPELDRDSGPEGPASSDPPPRSSYSPSHQGHSQGGPPPDLDPESGNYPGIQAGARNEGGGGVDESLRLLPVVEEMHTESGVEEDQPARTAMLSATMNGHPQAPEREGNWGETFKIEWLCTARIQFHQTRHLRNPWNHGREIKVSRDGTELEPSVGQRLIDSWSTLARDPAGGHGGNDARRTAASTSRRGGKAVPKPGPSFELKNVTQEPP